MKAGSPTYENNIEGQEASSEVFRDAVARQRNAISGEFESLNTHEQKSVKNIGKWLGISASALGLLMTACDHPENNIQNSGPDRFDKASERMDAEMEKRRMQADEARKMQGLPDNSPVFYTTVHGKVVPSIEMKNKDSGDASAAEMKVNPESKKY